MNKKNGLNDQMRNAKKAKSQNDFHVWHFWISCPPCHKKCCIYEYWIHVESFHMFLKDFPHILQSILFFIFLLIFFIFFVFCVNFSPGRLWWPAMLQQYRWRSGVENSRAKKWDKQMKIRTNYTYITQIHNNYTITQIHNKNSKQNKNYILDLL